MREGRRVLEIEARAVQELTARLDGRFAQAVDILYRCTGKVVISGMGKSGLIGQKIAATMASTGTPSFFLHPAEGIHGDLGMLARRDVLIAISNSGETQEVLQLLPFVKRMNISVVGMTGKMASTLAKNSDVTLDVSVDEEACPLGLAPTASTTATLAMGDALAVALLHGVEFFDRLEQADVAFLNQIHVVGAGMEVLRGNGDGDPQVGEDELHGRIAATPELVFLEEPEFFFFAQVGITTDFCQVLLERGDRDQGG